MLNKIRVLVIVAVSGGAMGFAARAHAQTSTHVDRRSGESSPAMDFRLQPNDSPPTAGYAAYQEEQAEGGESTRVMERETEDGLNWDLAGPYHLRSADPEEFGELEIKNIFGWSTSKGRWIQS